MIYRCLALFAVVASSFDAVSAFTTAFTTNTATTTAFRTTSAPNAASFAPSITAKSFLLFSDAMDGAAVEDSATRSADEAASEADEGAIEEESASEADKGATEESASDDEAPKVNPDRKRHTIFVGNLPFDATNSQLRELFGEQGTVELVSIPRDRETGTSRGFAFVDMSSEEEVQKAVKSLHETNYNGRLLRVQPSLPKEEARKQDKKTDEGTQKIYVGNLSFDSTKDDILEFYSQFGDVKEVYLPVNAETGTPRGFAFVTLDEKDAQQAIEKTNGVEYMGRTLAVSLPLPRGEKIIRKPREPRQKLYIGNLSFYTVADTVRELFEEFGTVHDCYLPEDPEHGGSRGFGFVTLDKEVSQAAIDGTDGIELDGRIIQVNEAQPKGQTKSYQDENDERDWSDDDSGL